eukprot:14377457-Ditylum_brightwellii.AAC.1
MGCTTSVSVLEKSEKGISFKATSNDVTATPKKGGMNLRQVMLNNKAFKELGNTVRDDGTES